MVNLKYFICPISVKFTGGFLYTHVFVCLYAHVVECLSPIGPRLLCLWGPQLEKRQEGLKNLQKLMSIADTLTDTQRAEIVRHATKWPFYGHALYPTFNHRGQEQIATSFI